MVSLMVYESGTLACSSLNLDRGPKVPFMDMEDGKTGRYAVVLAYYFLSLFIVYLFPLYLLPLISLCPSHSISFHRHESCRIVFSCYLRWEHTAKRARGLTFSLSIKMQIKKQNQVKCNWLFLSGLIDLVLRHSRPSGVRASICTRSGSLSKSMTDLREKKKQQKKKQINLCSRMHNGRQRWSWIEKWRGEKKHWLLILNNPT